MKYFTLNCKGKLLTMDAPIVMAILNTTPDSFFDGGKYIHEAAILHQVERQLKDGATIIDIGGMSTRPNAELISEEEELKRVIEPIKIIHQHFPEAILSIDTFRSKVAEEAVLHGVSIINDISGGTEDERIFEVAAKYTSALILMHKQGSLQTMHQKQKYENLLVDILDFFIAQTAKAKEFGIKDVIIDVGFGFSKTIEQNYSLLKNLKIFEQLEKPMLVGLSRKSMLYKLLNTTAENALNATTIVNTIALQNGASVLRVHDVKEAVECVKIWKMLNDK
ncbi:MAG TPA: dihydropteroate synthase [Chitinophagales bacterium]|nr:dihydropteroate synthase [Chitinophagales bacterium]